MTSERPRLREQAVADKAAREAREAQALRANLLRRKQQARLRAESDTPPPAPDCEGDAPCR